MAFSGSGSLLQSFPMCFRKMRPDPFRDGGRPSARHADLQIWVRPRVDLPTVGIPMSVASIQETNMAPNSERLALSGQDRDCIILAVGGMACGACANAVQTVLAQVPGVVSAEVDLGAGRAKIQGSARPQDLVAAVEDAGFEATLPQDAAPAAGEKASSCCGGRSRQ